MHTDLEEAINRPTVEGKRGRWIPAVAGLGFAATLGAGLMIWPGSGFGSSSRQAASVSSGNAGAFALTEDGIPPDLAQATSEPVEEPPFTGTDQPTMLTVLDSEAGRFLVITGGTDSLDAFLPEAALEVDPATGVAYGRFRSWTYVDRRDPESRHLNWVVMTHLGSTARTADEAVAVADHPNSAKFVARGDLSALTEAAPAKSFTYGGPEGNPITVRTFAQEHLDPILGYLAPAATPLRVGQRAGYAIDAGSENIALALDGGDHGLIVMVTSSKRGRGALEAAARTLEYQP